MSFNLKKILTGCAKQDKSGEAPTSKKTPDSKHKNEDSPPRIFHCHVPKCAGTSIFESIVQQLYPQSYARKFWMNLEASEEAAGFWDIPVMRQREYVLTYSLSSKQNYFGTGHVYCRPEIVEGFRNKWHFVTLLRKPVDRWISEYVYNTYKTAGYAKNCLTLDQYLDSTEGTRTATSFLNYFSDYSDNPSEDPQQYVEQALENLSKFTVVGTLENFDQWLNKMEQTFNKSLNVQITNKSPKPDATEEILADSNAMERIHQLCRYDTEIYQGILAKERS